MAMADWLANFGGQIAALVAACLWAAATVVYDRVGQEIAPLELNLVKGLLALLPLGATLLLVGDSLAGIEPLALGLLLLSGAIGIGLGDTAYFQTLKYVGPRRALLLGMLGPPLSALLALVLMGEVLTLSAWLGILITVLGVAWVVTERIPESPGRPSDLGKGVLFGLAGALMWAGAAVLSHAALVETAISPLWSAVLRMAAGLVVLAVWLALLRQPLGRWLGGERRGLLWGRLLFAVLVGTFLALWLQQVSLKLIPAGVAMTLLSTGPLFVLPLAALSGERISFRAVVGVLVALVGIALLFGLL